MSDVTPATSAPGPATNSGAASSTGVMSRPGGAQLVTEQGRTSIADSVVEKIAGMAARQVSGVHELGRGRTRAIGALHAQPLTAASLAGNPDLLAVGRRNLTAVAPRIERRG